MKLLNLLVPVTVVCTVACLSVHTPAFADGMPFKDNTPQPELTPLDKALNDIQNKQPPVDVTKKDQPAPAVAAAPTPPPPPPEQKKEEAAAPATAPAPVPETRVVEVQPNTSFFGLSMGMYDPFTHGKYAASFGIQFEPGVKIAGILQPLFGAFVTTNGALMGYGGVGVPFHVADHYRIMPSVAIGGYKAGGGVDLDRSVVWRVGSEFAYEFDDKSRIGLNVHMLTSSADLGRPSRHTEVIGIAYTEPFELLGGGGSDAPAVSAPVKPAEQTSAPNLPKPKDTLNQ